MPELLARFGTSDVRLLERVLRRPHGQPGPDRVVLDANTGQVPDFVQLTRRGGLPLLVDPQTYFLQDVQHAGSKWAQLPFADPTQHRPGDLLSPTLQAHLVAQTIDWELACGATTIIPPYVHVEKADDGWLEVQAALWRRTRRHLDNQGLALPVLAITAIGWRLLPRSQWATGLDQMRESLVELAPTEIALAGSKVDQGVHPDERLVDFIAAIRHLRHLAPVIAWQQGVLGEAAVAGGAVGYETGIGWRERCDLRRAMSADRRPIPDDSTFGARPVYIGSLRRSIPKRSVESLLETRLGSHLVCTDYQCCPDGPRSLLGDAREHALTSRARTLAELELIDRPAWRWRHLSDAASEGLELANRINRLSETDASVTRINTGALSAIQSVANHRRQTLRRRRPAA